MKIKAFYIFSILFLFTTNSLYSQKINILINRNSEFKINFIFNDFEILVSSKGLVEDWSTYCEGNINTNYHNNKLEGIGNLNIAYDSEDRIKSIGSAALTYGKENRLDQIGDVKIIYNAYNGEIEKIGDKALSYTHTSRKLEKIGNSTILYDYYERISGFTDKDRIFKLYPLQKSIADTIKENAKRRY